MFGRKNYEEFYFIYRYEDKGMSFQDLIIISAQTVDDAKKTFRTELDLQGVKNVTETSIITAPKELFRP